MRPRRSMGEHRRATTTLPWPLSAPPCSHLLVLRGAGSLTTSSLARTEWMGGDGAEEMAQPGERSRQARHPALSFLFYIPGADAALVRGACEGAGSGEGGGGASK